MRIRMKAQITGTFHNRDGGVEVGDIVDVEDVHAARYITSGLAEAADTVEDAVVDETAETAVVKQPRRSRPKKQPDWDDEHAPGWKKVDDDA